MKKILPGLTLVSPIAIVLLLAVGLKAENPTNSAQIPLSKSQASADHLLALSLAELASYDSVSAKIRQQIDLNGQELIGDGLYLQLISGRDLLLRLELKVQVGDQLCSSLQVSDGRDLWVEEQCGTERTVDRIDVRVVAAALGRTKPPLAELGGGRLPLGGLPEWLHSLSVNFQFTYAGETELAGVPVSMLVGTWRSDSLASMFPEQKKQIEAGQAVDLSKIPDHLPQEVVLLLGSEDHFPYLIDYRRYRPAKALQSREPHSLLRVQIYEVRIGSPIDLRQFVYQPGQVDVSDGTRSLTRLIGRRGARQAAAMKAAAAETQK
jgi:hypothetical protein